MTAVDRERPADVAARSVFLSYASEDAGAVERICEALRDGGLEVWFDSRELRGGDSWDRTIRSQIRSCRLFIPVISAHTEARSEGYFRREWKLAVDRTDDMAGDVAFLVPVVIDETAHATARVPPRFHDVQWTRLVDAQSLAEFVERVRTLVSASAGNHRHESAPGVPSGAASPPASATAGKTFGRRWTWAAVGGVILTIALFFTYRAAHPGRDAAADRGADRSIAVLPFVDMSERRDQEYFGDGLAEEVLDSLVKVPGLRVMGRTSSFQFKGKSEDLRKIGEALGAAHVVEGSVRRSGDRIRVTAQLVRTSDGAHEWSASYDRDAGDALEVQREIAAGISRVLAVTVEASANDSSGAKNPAVHDLYLRGLQAYERGDKAGMEQAADYFSQALDLQPTFVAAADGLALSHLLLVDNGFVAPREGWERVRGDVLKILASHPESDLGHAILARVYCDYDWNWQASAMEVDKALALDLHSTIAHYAAAALANAQGRWSDAESQLRTALTTDPLDPDTHQLLGTVLYGSGRFEEAAAEHRRASQIDPTFPYVHFELAMDLLDLGQPEAALTEMQLESPESGKMAGLAIVFHALGRNAESDAAVAAATRDPPATDPYMLGVVAARRGEFDRAFEWLERAYESRDSQLTFLKGEWAFKEMRETSRYKEFLRKMGLAD